MHLPEIPPPLAAVETIELLPLGAVRQLFILLPPTGGAAADMLDLASRLGEAFAEAAVLIAEKLPDAVTMHGLVVPVPSLTDDASVRPVSSQLPALIEFIRQQQERFQVLQTDTALAGFSGGASLALELGDFCDGIVGRVLAFSGTYTAWPQRAPQLTTLHLLHGGKDAQVPVALAQEGYARLVALGADATLDIAAGVGHALHPALMDQAVHRLQTCVPLRFWRTA